MAKPENERERIALEPCPFCGGEAELVSAEFSHYVRCMCCSQEFAHGLKEDAVAAWNRRAKRESGEPVAWLVKNGADSFVTMMRTDAETWGRNGATIVPLGPLGSPASQALAENGTVERYSDAIDASRRIHDWVNTTADRDGKVVSREIRTYTFNEDDGGAVLYFRNNKVAAGGFMVRDLHNFTVSMKVFAVEDGPAEAQARIEALEAGVRAISMIAGDKKVRPVDAGRVAARMARALLSTHQGDDNAPA